MAYVADYARSWSPARKARVIERGVDNALAQVAADQAAQSAAFKQLVRDAQAAVASLPEAHFAAMGAKHSLSAREAQAQLLRLSLSRPALVIQAVANTRAKLEV